MALSPHVLFFFASSHLYYVKARFFRVFFCDFSFVTGCGSFLCNFFIIFLFFSTRLDFTIQSFDLNSIQFIACYYFHFNVIAAALARLTVKIILKS